MRQDNLKNRSGKTLENLDSKFGKSLENLDSKIPNNYKIGFYSAIALLVLSLLFYNFFSVFNSNDDNTYSFNYLKPIEVKQNDFKIINPNIKKAIQLNEYLINLKSNPKTVHKYDSLKQFRPGLFDTIQYYLTQKQKYYEQSNSKKDR